MNDLKDEENSKGAVDPLPGTQTRRRFAKSGLAGGAVLMSLAGRSAFAKRPGGGFGTSCSVDTLFSVYNGGSDYGDISRCEYGCTPGFWQGMQPANTPAWNQINFLTGWHQGSDISVVFPSITGDHSALPSAHQLSGLTLGQVLDGDGGGDERQAVRHGLAAVLNSHMMGFYYTGLYSPQDIIDWIDGAWANYLGDPTNSVFQNALKTIHDTFSAFNERDCPFGADDSAESNPFFNNEFRSSIFSY